jgi:hypothetical protein
MVEVLKSGLKGQVMMVIMLWARKKDKAAILGQMALNILGSGVKIKLMAWALIYGMTEESIMVNGSITICMDMEFIFMLMELDMMDNLQMTKSKDSANTIGMMVVSTMDTGSKESSMGLAHTQMRIKAQLNMDFGSLVNELCGLMKSKSS